MPVNANGWSLTDATPTEGDTLTVTRSGFDATGAAASPVDTLVHRKRIRQPYPSQASLTADQIALSDFVYAGDVVSGETNNSTRLAPLPIAAWLTPDRQIARGVSTFTVKLAVAHAHARSGRPVAAVKFIASDGTTSVEQIVSAMSATTFSASGLTVPHFEWAVPLTSFAQGAAITVGAVIYPWVGAAFRIWDTAVAVGSPGGNDADAYPSPNLCALKLLNDRTGAYGTAYAYVSSSGSSGGVASANAATAQASPFATVSQAATAIKAFNNTTYGRNSADGGVIRLEVGTTPLDGWIGNANTVNWPLTIEAANSANRATTIFTDSGANNFGGIPAYLIIKDLTVRKGAVNNVTFLDQSGGAATYSFVLILDNCVLDANGHASPYAAWFYQNPRQFFVNCSGNYAGATAAFSTENRCNLLIGSAGTRAIAGTNCYAILGCYVTTDSASGHPIANAGRVAAVGMMLGWSHINQTADGNPAWGWQAGAAVGARGHAIVGNVLEQSGGTTGPVLQIANDGLTDPVQNIVRQLNTVVGSRSNLLYQDTGSTTISKIGHELGNIDWQRNTKSDVFGANANLIGNWPVIYRAAHAYNASLTGSQDGASAPGVGLWLGETLGTGEVSGSAGTPLATVFASNRSSTGAGGTGAGGGDYTPGSGNALPQIPAARVAYAVDQKNRAIPTDGTARAGALQMAATILAGTPTGASGSASTSSLGGVTLRAGGLTAGPGSASVATLAGAPRAAGPLTPAAGAATVATLAGSSISAGALTPATGAATTATRVGSATAAGQIEPAAGAASPATLDGRSTMAGSLSLAAGSATTAALAGVAQAPGASTLVPAVGSATISTLGASSIAAASPVVAAGVGVSATRAGSSTAAANLNASLGGVTGAALGGASRVATGCVTAFGVATVATIGIVTDDPKGPPNAPATRTANLTAEPRTATLSADPRTAAA